jgi:ribosomal protein L24E
MFIRIDTEKVVYRRQSKLGQWHDYERKKSVVVLRCDSCGENFTRDKGNMDPNRLNNNVFHCCSSCDPKRFAQKKGAERKIIWDKTVSSLDDISKL